ncbi:MAG: hypothetical protein M3R63_01620 [Actinomycetota bacterium]|nr:hypothetical protein [Actinomycetota bacterium]
MTDGHRRAMRQVGEETWAQETISLPADKLIGWQQVGGDPHAWHTLDAISIKRFILRRHTDAWKLVEVTAEISGRHGLDPDAARDWATRAARTQADTRIVSWVPGPTTADGYTTLHGSGTPR